MEEERGIGLSLELTSLQQLCDVWLFEGQYCFDLDGMPMLWELIILMTTTIDRELTRQKIGSSKVPFHVT